MQTRNPFMDEIAKAMEGAVGLAQAAGEEARSALRSQGDRWAAEFDLVRRDEYDALRARHEAEMAGLRDEVSILRTEIGRLSGASVVRPADDRG